MYILTARGLVDLYILRTFWYFNVHCCEYLSHNMLEYTPLWNCWYLWWFYLSFISWACITNNYHTQQIMKHNLFSLHSCNIKNEIIDVPMYVEKIISNYFCGFQRFFESYCITHFTILWWLFSIFQSSESRGNSREDHTHGVHYICPGLVGERQIHIHPAAGYWGNQL